MREELDIITAYNELGTFRAAADLCGTTHKTVKRVVERHACGAPRPAREPRAANYEPVRELVAQSVKTLRGRISAKRLLPKARAPGTPARPATSAASSLRRKRPSGPSTDGITGRRPGHRVSTWSSTGA